MTHATFTIDRLSQWMLLTEELRREGFRDDRHDQDLHQWELFRLCTRDLYRGDALQFLPLGFEGGTKEYCACCPR
jgi:hypothetical protein